MPRQNWGLAIATKDRPELLVTAIRLGLEQSRPPCEVVVVDASKEWEDHAAQIRALIAKTLPDIRLVYLQAERPSVARQRNQATAAAKADILFMLDDDSFMFPDCAERIMEVYEASPEILGVQAVLHGEMPDTLQPGDGTAQRKVVGAPEPIGIRQGAVLAWIRRHVFLMNRMSLFLPYSGSWPKRPLPAALKGMPVRSELLFHGCRMTFRRDAIQRVGFDPMLSSYSPGEDLDASHRVSLMGPLATAEAAFVHHFNAASGRIDRNRSIKLAALNQAYLMCRHADDITDARRRYFRLMWRRVLAETLKDGLSRRLSFPQLRGLLAAMIKARSIFEMGHAQRNKHYSELQARLIRG